MAELYWPGETPLGKRVRFGVGMDDPFFAWVTVVGVSGDVRESSLESVPAPMIYVPLAQATFGFFGDWGMTLVARTKSEPAAFINDVRQLARDLDPTLPLFEITTLEQLMSDSLAQRRSLLWLLEGFAAVALVLAAIGLYGVVSFLVSQRTQELGIRMALGAQVSNVLRLTIGQGLRLALGGITVGLVAALALTRVMSSLLFGVSVTDPFTFAVIALLLFGVALLACWIPARRATRVDPMIALKCE
jgi:ABC-type antimicrobial peptide transport system permease subunit